MKQSMRARRMAKNHKRMAAQSKLSLVSLMDIFTILVFFLMLNASDVQVLQTHKSLTLPTSSSESPADETLLLMVSTSALTLQGEKIADINDILAQTSDYIPALSVGLKHFHRQEKSASGDENFVGAITIMGDQALPYNLLKKIMQTCAQAGYTDISLAVEQQTSGLAGEEV